MSARADVHYVDLKSASPTAPYMDWSTAALTIQDAINVAVDGDLILVAEGVYDTGGMVMAYGLTNRVALNKAVTVQSVNGPWNTIIQGSGGTNGPFAARCAWLTNGASLVGFTLRAGATATGVYPEATAGGAVWCASSNATVANCIIISNRAAAYGGGAFQGSLENCFLSGNTEPASRGGAASGAVLNHCTITSNSAPAVYRGVLTNCIVYYNAGNNAGASTYAYTCLPDLRLINGPGNFTNAPQFFADGLRLTPSSPCVGAGLSQGPGTDLFGNPWGTPPSVGCAEVQGIPQVGDPTLQLTSRPVGFTITAPVTGSNPLHFSWLRNGEVLSDNAHFQSTHAQTLVVSGVGTQDDADFQLVVTNDFGAVTSTVGRLVFHYVDAAAAKPVAPYLSWAAAAATIQDAIDASLPGEIVLVTNGVYASGGKVVAGDLTNRIAVGVPLIVTSANGYAGTLIRGAWDPATTNGPLAVRCAWLTNGAVVSGFTLSQGATRDTGDSALLQSGGGAWCLSNAVVSNCVLSNNAAMSGAGIYSGQLNNSLVIGNAASLFAGGVYGSTLLNCTVVSNWALTLTSGAGASYARATNSIIVNNYMRPAGGADSLANYFPSILAAYGHCLTSPLISGGGNLTGDPLVLDGFHIATTSPCRGAGISLAGTGTDIEGEPWATPPAIGCDEPVDSGLVGPLSVALQASTTHLLALRSGVFTGRVDGRVACLAWSFGDGTTVSNLGYCVSRQWTDGGDFPVTFTAYNTANPAGVSASVIVQVTPINPPGARNVAWTTNGFFFEMVGQSNVFYEIESCTNLAAPVWERLLTIYSTGAVHQVTDTNGPIESRFFRLRAH